MSIERDPDNVFSPDLYQSRFPDNATSLTDLPLDILVQIISYLENASDVSHISRTCRLLHYLSLPQLYANVSLRSFGVVQKCPTDCRPRGCGMASPFAMALHGLALRNVGAHVKNFRLSGEWRQPNLEEYGKMGLVPDSDIMLNTLVRVAVDKMPVIQSFSWELDTKMLPTVWQGLAQSNISYLTVKFPTLRTPRPVALAPAMPNLKCLRLLDIDPLCYVDDVSHLIAESKKLEELVLVWSPRMKEAREPSVHMGTFFGRMPDTVASVLKRVAVKNLYTRHDSECNESVAATTLQEMTMINSITGSGDEAGFFESTWRSKRAPSHPSLKFLRVDKVSRDLCDFLGDTTGLEHLYLVCPLSNQNSASSAGSSSQTPLPHSPASSSDGYSSTTPSSISSSLALKDAYISVIVTNHGPTLRHLLLLPQWRLTADDLVKIFRGCPKLEQLGMGIDFEVWPNLRLLSPFSPKLKAIRMLDNPLDNGAFRAHVHALDAIGQHEQKLGSEQLNRDRTCLRWIEIADLPFSLGIPYPVQAKDGSGVVMYQREVKKRPRNFVEDMEIWKYSTMEV